MGNLIHNYLQNNQAQIQTQRDARTTRPSFSAPSTDSAMDSFDKETDKLIKPLDGKGYLVSSNPLNAPKEFVRDTVYTTKALVDGARGKANDHQLGKLNDLGLKIGGLAIATYLMTRKTTPKAKLMEFIGFGAFLASMKLWPKLALELPAKLVHGFNYRKKYVDDQGRKKEVGLDPNYMPFDLYRGEKKSENLDVIGDRLGIKKDLVNRQEATKEQMRKISVQNNTLWMLTAGIATPIMTALACNKAEKIITPIAEKQSNKKVNDAIVAVTNYLDGGTESADATNFEQSVLGIQNNKETPAESLIKSLKGKTVTNEQINELADTLADGFNADMKDAANQDIRRIIGGERYITNKTTAQGLANEIHAVINAADSGLAGTISAKNIEEAVAQGTIRGAVRNLLTSVGVDVLDSIPRGKDFARNNILNEVSTNFKSKDVAKIDFFEVTPETAGMTEVERLAHNIKKIIMHVNNDHPSEDFVPKMSALEGMDKGIKAQIDARLESQANEIAKQFYNGTLAIGEGRQDYVSSAVTDLFKEKAPKNSQAKSIFRNIKNALSSHFGQRSGFVLTEEASETITSASRAINRYNAVDRILSDGVHFKVEKANETLVANNWEQVSNVLFKELNITDADLKLASKNKDLAHELFAKRLEAACSNPESYKKLITNLANTMVQLDEKMDTPNSSGSGSIMSRLESGIEKNCRRTGDSLGDLSFTEMRKTLVSSEHEATGINIGSIMHAKTERLRSRINGVHSSYMRLIQTCEFFHRSSAYEQAIAELNADGANFAEIARKMGVTLPADKHKEFLNGKIAEKFGMDADQQVSKEIIERGKNLLLRAHTNQYYNKMGTQNNPKFFERLMRSIFRPGNTEGAWDQGWSEATSSTFDMLNAEVKSSKGTTPIRVFEGVKGFGQKLKEHMNQAYNTLSSITRRVYGDRDPLKIKDCGVSAKDGRASAIFDLTGKAPSEFFFDSAKQKFNTGKWMKTFKPILAATFIGTVAAQFLFGKKDKDIKA